MSDKTAKICEALGIKTLNVNDKVVYTNLDLLNTYEQALVDKNIQFSTTFHGQVRGWSAWVKDRRTGYIIRGMATKFNAMEFALEAFVEAKE